MLDDFRKLTKTEFLRAVDIHDLYIDVEEGIIDLAVVIIWVWRW